MRRAALSHLFARAAVLLVALALLARVAVPSGWMPMAEAGHLRLVLCPEGGPAKAQAAHHGRHGGHAKPAEPDHPDDDRGPCAFAAASLALDGPAPVELAAPVPIREPAAPAAAPATAPGRRRAPPPPPATGPPARA